ncbi:Mitochondrial dicarboxylate transporter [Termitomyces sp. J132]|nr:Mitochondrial dicarboxylate transporter [Termitomyces sp. J132]
MQTQESGSRRPSMISVLRASIAQSGIRNLYAGLTASLMRQMSYSLVRLGTYEELKARFSKHSPPSTTRLILAASLAGGLGGIADIILVRMTSDSIRPPEKRYGYVRAVLMNVCSVIKYDFAKSTLLRHPIPFINYQLHDNLLLHVIASTLAGTVATTVCSPADVIRSRVMASSGNTNIPHILVESLREEGPRFLLKGWTPAFMRLGPNTILMFVFFEVPTKSLLR